MKSLILILFTIFLFTSCGNDPEGVWQSDKNEKEKLVILKNEKGISIRGLNGRNWSNYISIGGDEYMSKSDPRKFIFLSNDQMQFTQPSRKEPFPFTRIVLDGDISVINKLMTREQVKKLIGKPEKISTEKLAEQWLYKNGGLLLFDEKAVFKINSNYKAERDFTKVKQGMTREEVMKILGKADREGKWDRSLMGFQKWFYGDKSQVIFDNNGVVSIIPDVDKKREKINTAFTPKNQSFSISQISSSPLKFTIESQLEEPLICNCSIDTKGPKITLKGEESSMTIFLKSDHNFTATHSYALIDEDIGLSNGPANEVELILSSDLFEKGLLLSGSILYKNTCSTEMIGEKYPCSFKGSFKCAFQ